MGPDGARCCRRARGRQGRCAPPKAVARRRAILDRHCARQLGLRRSGRKDGPRSNRRMRGDFPLPLPTCRGELGKRKPRMRLAEPISFRSGRPVDCHNSNLASFYVALAHHSTRANSIRRTPRPSLPRQILKRPWSKLATRTDHKPSETVTRNPGGRHQKPCSGSPHVALRGLISRGLIEAH